MEAAGGSCLPETVDILKPHRVSPKPRQTVSLNVKLVRGRRSLWKSGYAAAFSGCSFFFASVAVRPFLNLWQYDDRFRESSFRPPQSHGRSVSDRVSEEAAYPHF